MALITTLRSLNSLVLLVFRRRHAKRSTKLASQVPKNSDAIGEQAVAHAIIDRIGSALRIEFRIKSFRREFSNIHAQANTG